VGGGRILDSREGAFEEEGKTESREGEISSAGKRRRKKVSYLRMEKKGATKKKRSSENLGWKEKAHAGEKKIAAEERENESAFEGKARYS